MACTRRSRGNIRLMMAMDAGPTAAPVAAPRVRKAMSDPAFQEAYPAWREVRDSLDTASVRPVSPAYQSISTLITATLNPVGNIDPESTVNDLAEQVRKAVNSEGLIP